MATVRIAALALLTASVASAQPADVPAPSPPAGAEPAEGAEVPPPPSTPPESAAAQPAESPPPASPPAAGQPPPAAEQPPAAAPPYATQPPPAYAPAAEKTHPRLPVELFLGLGLGNAVCDKDAPDSRCPVDGAGAFTLGGGWRFHDHWSVGLELAFWSFQVREDWQGQLDNEPDEVKLSAMYLAPYARWYWFDHGSADPYLQSGLGIGSVNAEASNENRDYELQATGMTFHLGIGVEWQLAKVFRLGPQALAYLHVSSQICEDPPPTPGDDRCRDPQKNEEGEREGLALPWRILAVGTFTFGKR